MNFKSLKFKCDSLLVKDFYKEIFIRILFVSLTCIVVSLALTLKVHAQETNVKPVEESATASSQSSVTKVKVVEDVKEVKKEVCKLEYKGYFTLTGYCPCSICCGQFAAPAKGKTTAIGVGAYEGVTVAVDPKCIPYGTKIYIEGYGVRIASDCGGGIQGNHIDIYFATHKAALSVGKRGAKVYIVKD